MRQSVLLALLGLGVALVFGNPSSEEDSAKHWALLVAASKGWEYYRHQADVCHAYQIVHRNGIPDEQVVVMMYDDLAHNKENPTPGMLINRWNGPDVYGGVPKDYTGNDVTAKNFLAILKGDASAVTGGSGKVVKSGPNDYVFVYFTDHGAPGFLAFPNDNLHVDDLHSTIQYMYQNMKYKRMVFYIEACFSGSMMINLPPNVDVYATTSANPFEKSVACDYDLWRKTYLCDFYSVNWMENSDVEDLTKLTLTQQYKIVKFLTINSTVLQYGNKRIGTTKVIQFLGNPKTPAAQVTNPPITPITPNDLTPSPDVPLAILKRKLMSSNDIRATRALLSEISSHLKVRETLAKTMRHIVEKVTGSTLKTEEVLNERADLFQHQCYKAAVNHYKHSCFNWHKPEFEYALMHLYALVNLCERGYPAESILYAMDSVCPFSK
ncbi:legumain-like [Anableps anableps]